MLTQRWWAVVLHGVAAILFGMLCLAAPPAGPAWLATLFGLYALADGMLAFGLAGGDRARPRRTAVARSAAALLAGTAILVWPAITTSELLGMVAMWAFTAGALDLAIASAQRDEIANGPLIGYDGAFTFAFGVLLTSPLARHVETAISFGGYGIVVGGMMLQCGMRLRTFAHLDLLPRAHSLREQLAACGGSVPT
jgi:uncharacterized membrane protein HdeD (DUF308 family)